MIDLLLDTDIVLALVEERESELPPDMQRALLVEGNVSWVSVASLWELEIKNRIGKLDLDVPLTSWPDALFLIGIQLAPVEFAHIIGEIGPEPSTKDPFDRLLLSTAAAFQLKLVTLDRKLADHPLAWQPFLR